MPVVRNSLGFRRRVEDDPALLERAVEVVYAIWPSGSVAVKIGKTRGHPKERMDSLQTANVNLLRLVGYTATLTEKQAHRQLRPHHLRGEWYRIAPDLLRALLTWDWLDEDLWHRLRNTAPALSQEALRP